MNGLPRLDETVPTEMAFDVVVVGASAGGQLALRKLVDGLPGGFAVRVLAMLHLPPGAEPESVLQRLPLPVERLPQGQTLAKGILWVCPPRCFVDLLPDGSCLVSDNPGGALHKPIDRLFSSAARSFGPRALGVILSGMGADGALGAKALRAAGGRVLVQVPASAEYADMPAAAIATGAVDLVVPLDDMGEVVAEFAQGAPRHKARSERRAIETTFGLIDRRGGDSGVVGVAACGVDWQGTPLGPAIAWPDHLRWLVRDALDAPHAVSLWWGDALTEVYNDAFRPLLGTRHPRALGQSARQTWSGEWSRIGPLVDQVLRQGVAATDEGLVLRVPQADGMRHVVVNASFSPLRDAAARVLGVRCVMWETTQSVVTQRRMHLVQELGLRMARASTRFEACVLAAEALAGDKAEVPFALIYLIEKPDARATLASATGLAAGSPAAPHLNAIDIDEPGAWPLGNLLQASAPASAAPWLVEDLDARFPEWAGADAAAAPDPRPNRAALVPLRSTPSGQTQAALVIGLAPERACDEPYAQFLETLGQQVAAGLGDARAKELERERLDCLTALDRAKTDFFANVSHEFRTPLTLLLAPLEELARESEGLPAPRAAGLDVAVRNARRLLRLVDNLLDFSQIEARGRRARVAPVDLGVLTIDVASAFRSAIEAAGLQLRVDVAPDMAPVPVNSTMWEQVVSNLISNAFKFTFEGAITVRLQALRLHAQLEVTDSGIGIAAEELPNIFKRFHRVRSARSRTAEGSGIGLAMVQDHVNRMGGQVSVRSTPGRGSTFQVWVPMKAQPMREDRDGGPPVARQPRLAADLADEAARWAEVSTLDGVVVDVLDPPAEEASGASLRARLLVVDDNADLRQYLRRLLAGRWHVTLAAHGEQALALAREQAPDLVLADVMMPAMDGFQLLQQLRADAKLAHVPVLLLTARAGEESAIEGLRAGADDCIAKPFSPRELIARLQAALDRARAEATLRESEAKFRAVFETMIEACCIFEMIYDDQGQPVDWRILEANPGYEEQSGLKDVAGKLASEVMPGTEAYWIETFARVVATGVAEQIEKWHQPTGRWVHSSTARIGASGSRRLVSVFYDITERKQAEMALRESEERQAFLVRLGDATRQLSDPLAVQEIAARLLGEHLGADQVNVGETVLEAFRAGRTSVCCDCDNDPGLGAEEAAVLTASGFRACIALPLLKEGRRAATLAVCSRAPRDWTAQEIALVEETAGRTWTAVERARAEAALRRREALQRFMLTLSDAIRPLADPTAIQSAACDLLARHLGVDQVRYGAIDLAHWPAHAQGWRQGQSLAIEDVAQDVRLSDAERLGLESCSVRAALTRPLLKDGRVVAVMAAFDGKPRHWSSEDIEVLEATADRTWAAVQRADADVALRESEARRR